MQFLVQQQSAFIADETHRLSLALAMGPLSRQNFRFVVHQLKSP